MKKYFVVFFLILIQGCSSDGDSNSNTAPVADAGEDLKGKINSVITMDGSGSNDNDGDALTYSWTFTSTPTGSTATLSDADTVNPTLIPDIGGLYVVSLVVNDGSVNSNGDSTTVRAGALFPEYDPLGSFTNCTATYEWVVGPNTSQQFTTTTGGLETVNYTSGSLTGTIINGGRDLTSLTTYNDGLSFKMLRAEITAENINIYVSTDCAMSAHPEGWSFDIVYDGMLYNQGEFYTIDVNNPVNCAGPDTQKILFTIQDVTIQGATYSDAIIWWTIDENFPFNTVSHAELTSLGVISPTSAQTGGSSVTDVDIYAHGIGSAAGGDIEATTGTLNDFAERISGLCN